MALSRRSGNRFQASIWPGFVDAMTALLLVLMFVLTIFMIVQFMLRETITGQETELDELTATVVALSQELGLERDVTQNLRDDVGLLESTLGSAQQRIATLSSQLDSQATALNEAQTQITNFEAQVAGLLANRAEDRNQIVQLQDAQTELMSTQEALNLALADARGEIDQASEEARLAAARREALQALIADLEVKNADLQGQSLAQQTQLDDQIAALSVAEERRLADLAAADALRERLQASEDELTAMTLALEAKRKEAEDTLTLLAAAREAGEDLDIRLAAALSQRDALVTTLDTTGATLQEQQNAQAQQAARLLALQAQIDGLEDENSTIASNRDAVAQQLAAALAAKLAAERETEIRLSEAEKQAALLSVANEELNDVEAQSAEDQRKLALLNEQVAALRGQLGTLQGLLDAAAEADSDADIQLQSLGTQLNSALARAAAEERRRRQLEEAERKRIQAEAQDLEKYKSEFFGQLRDVLGGQEGVRIEGDRFVFSSEVLFPPGGADLSGLGEGEIAKIASILRQVADDIPESIDWVIRVDGHTDNVPLSGNGEFADNWELSQARALSVVKYMANFLGIPPQRLSANGFGQYQPLNPADTDEARAQNRRIELKFTEK